MRTLGPSRPPPGSRPLPPLSPLATKGGEREKKTSSSASRRRFLVWRPESADSLLPKIAMYTGFIGALVARIPARSNCDVTTSSSAREKSGREGKRAGKREYHCYIAASVCHGAAGGKDIWAFPDHHESSTTKALFSSDFFFGFQYCSIFVFIWQILFNHRLTRFKRFISWFTDKLCN